MSGALQHKYLEHFGTLFYSLFLYLELHHVPSMTTVAINVHIDIIVVESVQKYFALAVFGWCFLDLAPKNRKYSVCTLWNTVEFRWTLALAAKVCDIFLKGIFGVILPRE